MPHLAASEVFCAFQNDFKQPFVHSRMSQGSLSSCLECLREVLCILEGIQTNSLLCILGYLREVFHAFQIVSEKSCSFQKEFQQSFMHFRMSQRSLSSCLQCLGEVLFILEGIQAVFPASQNVSGKLFKRSRMSQKFYSFQKEFKQSFLHSRISQRSVVHSRRNSSSPSCILEHLREVLCILEGTQTNKQSFVYSRRTSNSHSCTQRSLSSCLECLREVLCILEGIQTVFCVSQKGFKKPLIHSRLSHRRLVHSKRNSNRFLCSLECLVEVKPGLRNVPLQSEIQMHKLEFLCIYLNLEVMLCS